MNHRMTVNDKLKTWKETVMVCFERLSQNLPGEVKENHEKVKIKLFWIEFQTEDLPNMK
jgi:hypothetical protein